MKCDASPYAEAERNTKPVYESWMNPEAISGIFWLTIGVLFCLWSINSYKIGTLSKPGAGFLPFFLSIFMILLSLMLLKKARNRSPITFKGWGKVVCTVLVLLVAALLFEKVGYLVTIFLSIILLMRGVERQSWRKIFSVAFLCTSAIYIVFVLLLRQSLPQGFIKF